jgi:hypothetical protein
MLLGFFNEKFKKNNSYGFMKIWSNFELSKVPNYDLVKVNKEGALDMNFSFHITTHTKSVKRIKM